MRQKLFWTKLIGVVLLLHVVLIVLSIIEVAVYSYLIKPGYNQQFYTKHAEQSGPWISIIFGSLLIFFLVRKFIKRFSFQHLTYAVALPVIYTITDYLIFVATGADVEASDLLFIVSHGIKILAGILAWIIYSKNQKQLK